jgi:AbiV family abortive infection protein
MVTTFDTNPEAQTVAAELNDAVGRERHVRYHVERYREKWAIARQSVRTYWGWDEFITRGSELRDREAVEADQGARRRGGEAGGKDDVDRGEQEAARTTAAKREGLNTRYLLQGAWYALEQCGLLLRDGNVLYRNSAYANAVVLTAFAQEELGRSSILLDLWRRALAGEHFTTAQIREACVNHVTKQRAGMLSLTMRADRESGLGKILKTRMENPPQSAEWQKADAELKRIDELKKKRIPTSRHEKRMAALYVEPISESEWNRPAAVSASIAHDSIQDAVNDYAGRYSRYGGAENAILKKVDPELYNALEQWSDRPVLQAPEWPRYEERGNAP